MPYVRLPETAANARPSPKPAGDATAPPGPPLTLSAVGATLGAVPANPGADPGRPSPGLNGGAVAGGAAGAAAALAIALAVAVLAVRRRRARVSGSGSDQEAGDWGPMKDEGGTWEPLVRP